MSHRSAVLSQTIRPHLFPWNHITIRWIASIDLVMTLNESYMSSLSVYWAMNLSTRMESHVMRSSDYDRIIWLQCRIYSFDSWIFIPPSCAIAGHWHHLGWMIGYKLFSRLRIRNSPFKILFGIGWSIDFWFLYSFHTLFKMNQDRQIIDHHTLIIPIPMGLTYQSRKTNRDMLRNNIIDVRIQP